jgi:hypothetical protein
MWIISKEGLIVIGVVAVLGIIGLVLLLQPARPPVAPATQTVVAPAATVPVTPAPPVTSVPATVEAVAPASSVASAPTTPPATSATGPVEAIDGVIYAGEYAHSTEAAGFEIHWSNDARVLRVGLISPAVGYLAVGFDPVSRMQGANFILGAVTDGKALVRDDFGTGAVAHSSDVAGGGTNDILEAAGCEANGKTYLEFVIPLDSGDAMDKPLLPGNAYKVLIAYHETNDDFDAWHSRRGSGTIALDAAP